MAFTSPPLTEINKQDIIRVALAQMGDDRTTWDYLAQIGIVRPPAKKYTFTVTAEVRGNRDPLAWNANQLARYLSGLGGVPMSRVELDTTEVDPSAEQVDNSGTVPVADVLALARKIKKERGYCSGFWDVLRQELGIVLPERKPQKVSFSVTSQNLRDIGLDPEVEIDADVLRSVLRSLGLPRDFLVVEEPQPASTN